MRSPGRSGERHGARQKRSGELAACLALFWLSARVKDVTGTINIGASYWRHAAKGMWRRRVTVGAVPQGASEFQLVRTG